MMIARVWHGLKMPPNEGSGITLNQFTIRVEEHRRTAESVVRQTVQTAGYDAQAFGLDGDGPRRRSRRCIRNGTTPPHRPRSRSSSPRPAPPRPILLWRFPLN
ncbi:hypothetical protein [Streptomyces sp. MK37H]|uniref:hypothetical protein n=1 Tax=Streptomyces sp. MK37H TaxID=2699117 RepID=UPI001B390ACB|nr:hypothetical protein [Streptomyces sp. MK37H]MBP8533945.1 hypothetical protein [Streptomyces sp. MK37H]